MSLYRVFCAASCTGNARAASNVIAAMRINVLDFTVASLFWVADKSAGGLGYPISAGYPCGCAPNLRRHGVEPTDCINCLIAPGDSCGFTVVVVGIALPVAVAFPSTRL